MGLFRRRKKREVEYVEQGQMENVNDETEVATEQLNNRIRESLKQVNSLLKFITEMDYVKTMLLNVEKQTEMIQGVASSSQEMTSSIEEISEFVQSSNEAANESIKSAETSISTIDGALDQIETTFEASKKVQVTMDRVNDQAVKIRDMVDIIKGVADQTNLLALNASIEAARAGEHGKGFSVVADEIKKLAENTKQQVGFITEIVSELTSEITNAGDELEAANTSFESGKNAMITAVDGMDSMRTNLSSIADNFTNISANVEQQTAASQEMTSSITVVNEKAQIISSDTDKTGSSFNAISQIVNDMRMELLKDAKDLDKITQLEICVSDHLVWRWRVYNMILGYEKLSDEQVGTHHTCRLGTWMDHAEFENETLKAMASKLSDPHEKLHHYAKDAIQAFNRGDKAKAEIVLSDIDVVSQEVITILNQMKKEYRKIK